MENLEGEAFILPVFFLLRELATCMMPLLVVLLSASLATEKESSDINVNLLDIFHKLTLQCQSLINSQSCCTNAEKINKHMVITLQNRSTNLPKAATIEIISINAITYSSVLTLQLQLRIILENEELQLQTNQVTLAKGFNFTVFTKASMRY